MKNGRKLIHIFSIVIGSCLQVPFDAKSAELSIVESVESREALSKTRAINPDRSIPVFVKIVAAFNYAAFSNFSLSESAFNIITAGRSQLRVVPVQRLGFSAFA